MIKFKEKKDIELKQSVNDAFLKTVSAFANFGGGKIVFGVNDDGKIVGVKDTKSTKLTIENKINDLISPKPNFSFEVDEKKKVVTLIVEDGKDKPYFYSGQIYKRNDTSTVALDINEQKRLILDYSDKYYDQLPVTDKDLKFEYLQDKLTKAIGIKSFNDDTLRTIELKVQDNFNNAASLLSDNNNYKLVDIVKFGENINIFLERVTIEKVSILKAYYDSIEVFKRYYVYEEIKGFNRETIEKIPESAFREAIVNALIHRDWSVDSFIRIEMYDEKVVIVSPGGLPMGLSEVDYLNGNISQLRNPIIANIFYRLKLIEKFGTGVRKIKMLYENIPNKPKFQITENAVSITLPIIRQNNSVNSVEKKFLNNMQEKIEYSSEELAKINSMTKATTLRLINKLLEKDLIIKKGIGRSTTYVKMYNQ